MESWAVPEGSRRPMLPDFKTIGTGKVVGPMHQPRLRPGYTPGIIFFWDWGVGRGYQKD